MPWRNGGGVTSEILVERAGERFLYRLSIADVTTDGPFSRFEGYDRHIVVLEGKGMTLDANENGRMTLVPFEPRAFSGDWDIVGRLVGGAVKDFNLIVDRAWASSSLEVRAVREALRVESEVCMVHVIEGTLADAETGDTLVGSSIEIRPRDDARVAIARIVRR